MLCWTIFRQEITSVHAHQNVNKENSVTSKSVSTMCIANIRVVLNFNCDFGRVPWIQRIIANSKRGMLPGMLHPQPWTYSKMKCTFLFCWRCICSTLPFLYFSMIRWIPELSKNHKRKLDYSSIQCFSFLFLRYITEKFYRALDHKVIPVALGAPLEEYTQVAPENSFLHVDNFTSPKVRQVHLYPILKCSFCIFSDIDCIKCLSWVPFWGSLSSWLVSWIFQVRVFAWLRLLNLSIFTLTLHQFNLWSRFELIKDFHLVAGSDWINAKLGIA